MHEETGKHLRVLYLFNGSRVGLREKAEKRETHRNGFWGMLQLSEHGIEADYLEIEELGMPARLLRKLVPIYFVHLLGFPRFFSYDIVYTSTAFGSQFVFTLLRMLGIKTPLWVMQDFSIMGLLGGETTLRQKIFAFMVSRADGIVTVGKNEEKRLKGRFPQLKDRIVFIPFGVDLKFFKPIPGMVEERRVLAVGFDPDRDWKTLFAAVKDLPAKAVVATRASRVKELSIPSNVDIATLTSQELVEAYARSAIVAIPLDTSAGVNDAMGCSTLFEAMAMGKAIVATQTHTIETYVENGQNGVLVEEGDAPAMRGAFLRLLNDREEGIRLGRAAREYALHYLDSDKLAGELAAFFKRVILLK